MPTTSAKQKYKVGDRAAQDFGHGFHCAEAVAAAVLETLGEDAAEAVAHATAFGGGIGRTHLEVCGALAGALVAIGHLHGRRRPGGDWDAAAELGAAMRQRFEDHFGTTRCAALRRRFGAAGQMEECRQLTGWTAATLVGLIDERPADE
jgi:C_GCAxxG_C_C family probable redox protein